MAKFKITENKDLIERIGVNVKSIRVKKELNQNQLAVLAGTSPGMISKIENGLTENVWLPSINTIANCLGVGIGELLK